MPRRTTLAVVAVAAAAAVAAQGAVGGRGRPGRAWGRPGAAHRRTSRHGARAVATAGARTGRAARRADD